MHDWRGVLAEVERVATRAGRVRAGRYAIEGTRLHERALAADLQVEAALVARRLREGPARVRGLLARMEARGSRLHFVPDGIVERLTGGRDVGWIVGLLPLPVPPRIETVLANARSPVRLLVAAQVEDPGNVGALVRTALGCGAAGLVAVGPSDPFHPKAVRTSMGSLFRLPVIQRDAGVDWLAELGRLGVTTVGAVSQGGLALPDLRPSDRPVAVVVGNEAFGLSVELLGRLDRRVTIPMAAPIDSLSVNAAAAILLWELGGRGAPPSCARPEGNLR